MRSTKDQLVKKDVLMPVKHNVFLWNLSDVEEVPSHSPLVSMERKKGIRTAADSVRSEWPLWHAAKSKAVFARRRSKSKPKRKLLDIRAELERKENARGARAGVTFCISLSNLSTFLINFCLMLNKP
ncbi:hypothetical protein TNCV_3611371 [Trichonephila clavipes]|nr:hypothetical protein TNCV_3611371 [Trichonephila clavipes]